MKLKEIEILLEEKFLDPKQLKLAQFISEYYFSPLGSVLKLFVPQRTKSRPVKSANTSDHGINNFPKIILTDEQDNAVNAITKNHKLQTKNYLLFGPSGSGKTEVYIHSILKLKKKDPKLQFLILLPELTLTPQAIERYGQYFAPQEIVVLHSKISKGQFFSNWQKIKSGEAKIVIASRQGIFAPFKKLGLIVIDEEQDMSFKQWDMTPRYDARTAAEKLAEIHACPIVFGSATPRLETYHRTQNKEIILIKLPELNIPNTSYYILDTILVDMRLERWLQKKERKNLSSISKTLRGEIAYALRNKSQAILFINRQGMSNFSVCAKCKTLLVCPKCERALVYQNSGVYRCSHCAHETSILPECSKCHSLEFRNVGLGTQKVEKEIKDLFPSARILRVDTETTKGTHAQEKIYQDFKDGKADILIGTQMISKGWDLRNVSLVGIIDADNMLSVPDFSTNEKAFQILVQVMGRANRPGAKLRGIALIQTFHPENKLLQQVCARDYSSFYATEIIEREALKIPPYGKIIKLLYQDFNLSKAEKEAKRIHQLLENIPSCGCKISTPQSPFISKVRGKHRQQIIVKSTTTANWKNFPELKKILSNLPEGWIIDVDPISII